MQAAAMQTRRSSWTFIVLVLAGLMALTGCPRKKSEEAYLIRVRTFTLNLPEFNQAVQAARADALEGDREMTAADLNDLRLRVLNQFSEEMMIAAFAADHGITISDEELEQAVNAIKADYPDTTFEETLLENAISYPYWRQQLATRLLIEKVIAGELIHPVQITDEDIAQYYKTNYPQGTPAGENANDVNHRIVIHLRRQKAESAYKEWIAGLRQTYPVDVNQKAWNDLIAAAH